MLILSSLVALALSQAPERLHIDWRAPDECPALSDLESLIEDTVPKNHTFSAHVKITPPEGVDTTWTAVVKSGPAGEYRRREVRGPDCNAVSQAALLVITLAASQLPDEESPRAPLPVGDPVEPSPAPPAPVKKERAPLRFSLGIQPLAGLSLGVVPGVGVAFGGGATIWLDRFRVSFGVRAWLDAETPEVETGAFLQNLSVEAQVAWLGFSFGRFQLGPQFGADVMNMTARATGIENAQRFRSMMLDLTVGVLVGIRVIERLRVWLALDGGIAPLRPRFFLLTETENLTAHQVSFFVGRLSLGLEFEVFAP